MKFARATFPRKEDQKIVLLLEIGRALWPISFTTVRW